MKKLNPFLAILFILILLSNCKKEEVQPVSLDFQSFPDLLPQNFDERVNSINRICKDPDGGFMLLADVKTDQVCLIKLSAQGDLSSQDFFGTPVLNLVIPSIQEMIPASDGDYILGGQIDQGSQDAHVMKMQEGAYHIWGQSFGDEGSQCIKSLTTLDDRGYLFCGFSDRDVYYGRINKQGISTWTATESYSDQDVGADILQVNEDEFLLLSLAGLPENHLNKYPVLSKYDMDGQHIWTQSYQDDTPTNYSNAQIVPAHDGGFLIFSNKSTNYGNNTDWWVIKVDENGVKEWGKNYGGLGLEEAASITPTNDNAYLLLGTTTSQGNLKKDIYLVKINTQGEEIWARAYGGEKEEIAYDLAIKEDGGFIIGGYQVHHDALRTLKPILLQVNAQGIPE